MSSAPHFVLNVAGDNADGPWQPFKDAVHNKTAQHPTDGPVTIKIVSPPQPYAKITEEPPISAFQIRHSPVSPPFDSMRRRVRLEIPTVGS